MMEKIDRRIRRTQKLLTDAFTELIHEKNYEDITIKEITERADVAYVTFYRHYSDKDEFFLTILDDDIGELKRRIAAITPNSDPDDNSCMLMFEHIEQKKILYQSLFSGTSTARIREQMKAWYVASLLETNREFYTNNSNIPFEIAANHIAGSCVELIDWWLKNDMSYSTEKMGEILRELIINGTWHIVARTTEAK